MKDYYQMYKRERRYAKVFLENLDGQSIFVSKFIRPQEPPEQIVFPRDQAQRKRAIERAARYVSLIPFMEDQALFQDMPDLTCNS